MTSLLAGISGKFRFPFLISTFTPVLIFLFLIRILIIPQIPYFFDSVFWEPVKGFDEAWELLTILAIAIVMSVLLEALNLPMIRMYEGYPWQNRWIGRRRKLHYQRKYDELAAERDGWTTLRRMIEANPTLWSDAAEQMTLSRAVRFRGNQAALELRNGFPARRSILPTHLGNVVRAFETYPRRQYGMGAITLYPRLAAVMGKDHAESILRAKSSLDFMLNCATLTGILSGAIVVTMFLYPGNLKDGWSILSALLQAGLFLLLARWFYHQGIGAAAAWGNAVKSAFDLYRNELLTHLGFDYAPSSVQDERRLWENITRRIAFGDPPADLNVALMPYAPTRAANFAVSTPEEIEYETLRTIEPAGSEQMVRIQIRNTSTETVMQGHKVRDRLPDGYGLSLQSLTVSPGSVTVSGSNPYTFAFDTALNPGDAVVLRYKIVHLPERRE